MRSVWEKAKKGSTHPRCCYHYDSQTISKGPPTPQFWSWSIPFSKNESNLCSVGSIPFPRKERSSSLLWDAVEPKASGWVKRRGILTFERGSAANLPSYLWPDTSPFWRQLLWQWQSIFRTVKLWRFTMNDLVSDTQILIKIATVPALEQKWFLGQEWEKLCRAVPHAGWASGQALEFTFTCVWILALPLARVPWPWASHITLCASTVSSHKWQVNMKWKSSIIKSVLLLIPHVIW